MNLPRLEIVVLVTGLLAAGFALLWWLGRSIRNHGIVDVAWAAAFTPVALLYAFTGAGPVWRKGMMLMLATLWSLRLALHLGRRVAGLHPREDGRYEQLRRDWGAVLERKMFLFFQAQALTVVAFSWPFLQVCWNRSPNLATCEWVGAALVVLAVTGEAWADAQLAAFKRARHDAHAVCDCGLWRFSRHPNYFFEWLTWIGFALCAWPAPSGWTAWACPAVMLWLLLQVTGVRTTEKQLERSKGAAYRAYRARTSAFFPWFPRTQNISPRP